jgi:membrane-bound serine protease (ClpP class)
MIRLLTLFVTSILLSYSAYSKEVNVHKILSLEISSSINPATLNYIKNAVKKQKDHQILLIKMNTPGGLVTTTKEILTLFGESDVPVIVWVTPEGASATSAGAIIASGAHFLFMSQGTNIGAATPVQMGKDIKSDLRNKAINDLVALVEGLAKARGRNASLFGEMITKASSFDAQTAEKKILIDSIINNEPELIRYLNGKSIDIKGEQITLNMQSPRIVEFKMDLGQHLLNIFANPSLAYILFLIGAALLYLEMQAPGGFLAGSVGAVCLLLAGIGFQVLPLNFGALGLIILSFALFIIEIYVVSYGILSIAGIAALSFGSLFLYRTQNSYLELSTTVIVSSVSAISLFVLIIGFVIIRDLLKNKKNSFFTLEGKQAQIKEILEKNNGENHYLVKIAGETWKAYSANSFSIGQKCKVVGHDKEKMRLLI